MPTNTQTEIINYKELFKKLIKTFLFASILTSSLMLSLDSVSAAEQWDIFFSDTFLRGATPLGLAIADTPERVLLQFYPIEQWEIDVCTRDLTSMKERGQRNGNLDEPRVWYDGASIALSASYYYYDFTKETLYDVDWYIEPRGAIKYSVYLRNDYGDVKKFFVPDYSNITTDDVSTGAFSQYYRQNYTVVGIEYITLDDLGAEESREYLETDISPSEASYG